MNDYLWLLLGFALLIGGGDLLIRNAVKVAASLKISATVIGIVLLGFGTSAPELVTSIQAAKAGSPGIAVGNFVGSNIANVLCVLGFAALVAPIALQDQKSMREGWLVVISAVAFAAAIQVVPLDRTLGLTLLGALVAYLTITLFLANKSRTGKLAPAADEEFAPAESAGGVMVAIFLSLVGLVAIICGSDFLVQSAISIANRIGVSQSVIGVSVVALGTSLPELVTVTIAALQRRGDMAIGGIVGSNIYNTLMIGGVTGTVAPAPVPDDIVSYDVFVMVAASLALIFVTLTGKKISRVEGFVLLACYCAFIWSIWPADAIQAVIEAPAT